MRRSLVSLVFARVTWSALAQAAVVTLKASATKLSLIALALSLTSALALAQSQSAQSATPTDTDISATFSSLVMGDAVDNNGTPINKTFVAVDIKAKVRALQKGDTVYHSILIKERRCPVTIPSGSQCAQIDTVYYVSDSDYASKKDWALGLATGILAVPFKYHRSDHATTGGTTIGGYIGISKTWSSVGQLSLILGGGLALVPSTPATTSTTTTSSSTLTGISIATGVIGKVGSTNTQFGVLLGYDSVDKNANYKYDGRPWLSFTVGYSFSN